MGGTAPSRARLGFAFAALAALVVVVVFVTLGDGVDAAAEGWRGVVLDDGHALVWILLTAGLGVAGGPAAVEPNLGCAVRNRRCRLPDLRGRAVRQLIPALSEPGSMMRA